MDDDDFSSASDWAHMVRLAGGWVLCGCVGGDVAAAEGSRLLV